LATATNKLASTGNIHFMVSVLGKKYG
jgi:hypothetical protein